MRLIRGSELPSNGYTLMEILYESFHLEGVGTPEKLNAVNSREVVIFVKRFTVSRHTDRNTYQTLP